MTIRITGDGPKITATGSGSTVLVEISTGQHDPGSFSGVHNDLSGRSTTAAHPGDAVSIDPAGFAGNLDGTITNAQLLAAAVDDLAAGGGGGGAVDSVDGRTGAVTLDDLYQTVGVDVLTDSATLDGPPRTVITAIVDGTVTFPTAGVGDVGQHWHIATGPYELTVAGCDGGDVTVPVGMVLSVVGYEAPGPVYGWAQLGFKTINAPTGGGADLSDTTPQALGTAAAGTGTAAARDDHVHAMPTAADVGAAATSHNHAASEVTSGTLDIARIPTGTTSTTVPLGNDSRFTDSRTPNVAGSNDDFMQRKSGAWTYRTPAQVKTDLGLTPIPGITGWYADGVYSGLQGTMHSNIGGGGAAMTPGADLLWLWRIMPVETIDVDGAYFVISTSGTSGAVARVGIYAASSSTTEPTGAPLCDTTGLAVTDAGGSDVVGSFTAVRLTAWTPYWGFMLTNNATFAPRFLSNAANTVQSNRLDTGQVTGSAHTMRRVSATYGTPPTNPSAPFTTVNSVGPGVLWKTRRV